MLRNLALLVRRMRTKKLITYGLRTSSLLADPARQRPGPEGNRYRKGNGVDRADCDFGETHTLQSRGGVAPDFRGLLSRERTRLQACAKT